MGWSLRFQVNVVILSLLVVGEGNHWDLLMDRLLSGLLEKLSMIGEVRGEQVPASFLWWLGLGEHARNLPSSLLGCRLVCCGVIFLGCTFDQVSVLHSEKLGLYLSLLLNLTHIFLLELRITASCNLNLLLLLLLPLTLNYSLAQLIEFLVLAFRFHKGVGRVLYHLFKQRDVIWGHIVEILGH